MVIGFDELHRRIKEERLIENLSDRELQNPEGIGLDLRIGKVFRIGGKAFLGVTERETPGATLVARRPSDRRLPPERPELNRPGDRPAKVAHMDHERRTGWNWNRRAPTEDLDQAAGSGGKSDRGHQ